MLWYDFGMNEIYVESIKTERLIPYARNSRTHSAEQVAQIAASIREFGFTNPVLIDEQDGIIAGHGRVMAARSLSLDDVPCIRLAHLTEAQKRAYVIADNRLALNAGWDMEMLKIEIQELQDVDFDVNLLGFGVDELSAILEPEPEPGLTNEDAVPELPEEPVTKPGDVWILGHHRVMCGDSTSIDAVDMLMQAGDWDVCVFDPPYDIESLYADAMPISQPDKKLLVFWDFKRFAIAPHSAMAAGWNPLYEFIWDCVQSWYTPNRPLAKHKAVGLFGDDPAFDTNASVIQDGKDRGQRRNVGNTRGQYEYAPLDGAKHIATVEAFPNTMQSDTHGHGKPVAWIEAIFNGIGGNVYLDLFGGSGSTLIACQKTHRQSRLMELDPRHCDVIIKRWQDFTGQSAVLESSGKTFNELHHDGQIQAD